MKEPQILSVFQNPATASARNGAAASVALVFDACQVGVVLRAVHANRQGGLRKRVFPVRIEVPA